MMTTLGRAPAAVMKRDVSRRWAIVARLPAIATDPKTKFAGHERIGPFVSVVRRVARAVETGRQADGSFVEIVN